MDVLAIKNLGDLSNKILNANGTLEIPANVKITSNLETDSYITFNKGKGILREVNNAGAIYLKDKNNNNAIILKANNDSYDNPYVTIINNTHKKERFKIDGNNVKITGKLETTGDTKINGKFKTTSDIYVNSKKVLKDHDPINIGINNAGVHTYKSVMQVYSKNMLPHETGTGDYEWKTFNTTDPNLRSRTTFYIRKI